MPHEDCCPNKPRIFVLCSIIIFISIHHSTNGQDFEFNIEPSFDINKLEDTKLRTEEDAGSWDMRRQTVSYQTQVGKFFNVSISEIVDEYGVPKDESYTAQVHIMNSANLWLTYSQETQLLQGVPTNEHVGDFTLLALLRRKFGDLTVPIKISVVKHADFIDDWLFECAVNEPTTMMSLSLSSADELDKLKRNLLILKLSSFFNQKPSKFLLHYYSDSNPDDRVFLSGRGNADSSLTDNKIVVSWNVGCGSDEDVPGLEMLESSSQDGSLEQWVGFSVIEWKVFNRVLHQNLRLRRALQDNPSDNSNSKLKSEPITRGEESVQLKTRGRTRVQLNLIRNTPIVKPPVMASKLMTHKVMKPTKVPPTNPAPMIANQPPMEVFGILDLNPQVSCYFEFLIPGVTFYDKEDGNAKNLRLQLFNASSQMLIEEELSWPRFDSEDQILYGVPPPGTPTKNTKMLLMASDKEGTSTTTEFNLKVNNDEKLRARNHRYTFYLTETEKDVPNDVFLSEFGRKLAIAIAKTDNDPGSLMMVKTDYLKNGQRYVAWYDQKLNSDRLCYEDEMLDAGILMVGPNGMEGKNKPEKVFAGKFRPEYKLRNIKIEYFGPCTRKTTTLLPPSTTESDTTTEEATTGPSYDDEEYTEMPPVITPPPTVRTTSTMVPPTTTKEETTTEALPLPRAPMLTGKSIPDITANIGKPTLFKLPTQIFKDSIMSDRDLEISLVPYKDNGIPAWVQYLPKDRTILIFPTLQDYESLNKVNDSYSMWTSGIVAKNKDDETSEALPLKIFVFKDEKVATGFNHEFQINIANYNVKDFSVNMTWKLVSLLADVFGGSVDEIFVHPLKQGSVIFSWHNSTLGNMKKCPTKEIMELSKKIFTQEQKFTEAVAERFSDAGLEVTKGGLMKKNSCIPPPLPPTTTEMEETTSAVDLKVGGGNGVIIIAVVVVCLLLLIIILVVKCKMAAKRKQKKKNQNNLALQESSVNAQSAKIKKGVPIIFQEELNGGKNGGTPSDGTPLLNITADSSAYNNNNDHTIIGEFIETTPFNQSGVSATPITAKRTPPPYHPR